MLYTAHVLFIIEIGQLFCSATSCYKNYLKKFFRPFDFYLWFLIVNEMLDVLFFTPLVVAAKMRVKNEAKKTR